ncbi:MAG: flagellar motor switch protein FliN [Deltaproteobacteria bacterium]|nr:flagellar motor switch protein FliN [Deltaproteobacteria bacterium]
MSEESREWSEAEETGSGTAAMAQDVDFADMEPGIHEDEEPHGMEFLLDIPLDITVELGRTRMPIGDLLKLSQGSVVELNKLINQPLDIFVNQKLMAQGEVVVVNEKFGVRLSHIISPGERVKSLT